MGAHARRALAELDPPDVDGGDPLDEDEGGVSGRDPGDEGERLALALEEELDRAAVAARLRVLADALAAGDELRVEGWEGAFALSVPPVVRYDLAVEVGARAVVVEIALRWAAGSVAPPRAQASRTPGA